MDPIMYLESLIAGQKLSSIPVQTSELELLLIFMKAQQQK